MSRKEIAYAILDRLTDEQLNAFIVLFGSNPLGFPSVVPDEIDRALLADSREDNNDSLSLDDFAKELGFDPNDLQA